MAARTMEAREQNRYQQQQKKAVEMQQSCVRKTLGCAMAIQTAHDVWLLQ
jgi:hypothetical protein